MPDVVWHQLQETHITNIHETSTTEAHRNTHMPELRQRNDVESQTSQMKETSAQVSGSSTEPFLKNKPGSTTVQNLNHFKKRQLQFRRHEMKKTANDNGDDNISLPKTTTSQTEERLVRDDFTNELYKPLSTIVLKRKKRCCMFLWFSKKRCSR